MPPGDSYRGSYRGDPRGRERAISNRQTAQRDIQSQVDSFSSFGRSSGGYDKGPSMDQMRSRTFSAPAPVARTPVQKAYNEIRTRTPTVVKRTTRTPREVVRDVDHDSGGSVARNIQVGAGVTLAALAGEGVRQRSSDIKQIKGFLEKNKGLPLTEAQKVSIKYGAKVPNTLAKSAYGVGSWKDWWNARTAGHHFGPVESATRAARGLTKMLGPVGLLEAGYNLASGGTTALLQATGGGEFYGNLGSKIAQKTGATTTPQSAWSDLLSWVEGASG